MTFSLEKVYLKEGIRFNISLDYLIAQRIKVTSPAPHSAPSLTGPCVAVSLNSAVGATIEENDVLEARFYDSASNDRPETRVPMNMGTRGFATHQDGLFFQQLQAFQFVGNNLGPTSEASRRKEQEERFVQLLRLYMRKSETEDGEARVVVTPTPSLSVQLGNLTDSESESHEIVVGDSDCESKSASSRTPQSSPSIPGIGQLEKVFEIVFNQQSIGMKLGSDRTKKYAVVKECFEDTEASRYAEIQPGIVILAVNGDSVAGIGLSRTLVRLREAQRPVVVRFGKPPKAKSSPYVANM